MKTKQEIRKYIKNLFLHQNKEELKIKNENIFKKFQIFLKENTVQNICIYESMNDEVDTKSIIAWVKTMPIGIYTPQCISETKMILIDDNYEIHEKNIDLFIIPWRAFSKDWKRIWRGKWYYDRFLSQTLYKKSKKLGFCYNFQILENIPTQKYDVDMDAIIND